ncbi:MAG: universal stress protein [Caldimicrobium sp.]|jgi:nucleotide-binding universal stress UspA family protein|nr:universal stress protein [Caldimicrobium sp.]MCC6048229.1 universal stress protein [Thermodesulfobacterium sp.]
MFKKILIGYDGYEGSLLALEKGLHLAEELKAEVIVLSVASIPEYAETVSEVEEAKEQARKYYTDVLSDVERLVKGKDLKVQTLLRFGKPAEVILHTAEEMGIDLIILGPSKYSYLRRRILGSTADKVVERAHCSVLIMK